MNRVIYGVVVLVGLSSCEAAAAGRRAKPAPVQVPEIAFSDQTIAIGDRGRLARSVTVIQVIDDKNMLGKFGDGVPFWFATDTAGLSDGQTRFLDDRVFAVNGRKQYRTANGSTRTVLVFEEVKDAPPFNAPIGIQKPAVDREAARWRTWTTADGKYRAEAKFVSAKDGVLTLQRRDGATVALPLARLCKEDQEFVRFGRWNKLVAEKPVR